MSDAPDSVQKQQLLQDIEYQRQLQETFLSASESEADNLLALLDSLKGSLPRVNEAPTLAMSDPTSFRIKRGIGAMLLRGIFGTFMGLYNRRKLSNLREQVETVAARQNRLLQITAVTLQQLYNLESMMTATMTLLAEDIDVSLAHCQLRFVINSISNTNRSPEPSKLPISIACQLIFSMPPGCKIYFMWLSSKPRSTSASSSYLTLPIYFKLKRRISTTVKIFCCYSTYPWPQLTPSYGCSNFIHFCFPSPRHTSCCPSR
jgi:hypothetical protein